ncbi:MAG: hypothetical protein LBI87_05745 [Candidatus Accumulibacter sp.]|jgi:hypothetical protein|nr:hypothetical protein [Accumulibacter sp.]
MNRAPTASLSANPWAGHGGHVDGFRLAEAEYGVVRMFNGDSRAFPVEQGHHPAMVKPLAGLGDGRAVPSGGADDAARLDTIRAETGEAASRLPH